MSNIENCPIPLSIPDNSSELEKVQHMAEKQKWFLCRIASLKANLNLLQRDLAIDGYTMQAEEVRGSLRKLQAAEMHYMELSRQLLRRKLEALGDTSDPYHQTR